MNIFRLMNQTINHSISKDAFLPLISAVRTTYIVERVYPPPLTKLRAKRPRILKARNFVYKTVENTDLTDPPDLHVVLTTFVDGIGDVGDVISLSALYAREHLLLPRKAAYATPENIEKYGNLKKSRTERPKFSSIHSGMMVKTLSKVVFPILMNSETPWTIQKNHVHLAFRIENFKVPIEAIELPATPIEGPDKAKEGGDFAVTVTINNVERVPVRCRIFHIQLGLEKAKLSEEFYLEKGHPVLEEQKELLESMPSPEIIDDPTSNVSLIEKYRIQYIK